MAGGQLDNNGGQVVIRHSGEGLLLALPQGLDKQTVGDWKDATADYVRRKMFDKKQFVSDDDLVMGGHIQKLVTFELNINNIERQKMFWEEGGGRETVRETVRKKRQAAQNAMKLAFRG
jgi:hypothetical protein